MALAQVSVVPVGTRSTSIGDPIADAVRVLRKAKVRHQVSALGTLFEGSPATLFPLVRRMHEAAFKGGARRVMTTVLVDDRRDKRVTLESKVAAVRKRLS